LRKEHPYYKPIVFVTPTPEMGIAPSRFVNTNGNVFLPYLDEWKQVGWNAVFEGVNVCVCVYVSVSI
jgi:hypothetical protein